MKRLVIFTLIMAGLAGCGGGSSSVIAPVVNTDYVLFTSATSAGKSLRAFDPDVTPYSAISTLPTTDLQYEAAILDGTVDPATQTASNLHIGRVLYQDNGSFYSVATAKSGSLTVSQHSSYGGTVCDPTLTNNYLVFTDDGLDGNCLTTNDNLVHAVSTNLSGADPAINLPAVPVAVLFNDLNSVMGLIMNESGSLVFTDENGTLLKNLQQGVSTITKVGSAGNNVLLDIDGNLKIFNDVSKSLSTTLYAQTGKLTKAISDGNNYYFLMIGHSIRCRSMVRQLPLSLHNI